MFWTAANLIALVRYVHDGTITENFLFCEAMKKAITAKDMLQLVKDVFGKRELENYLNYILIEVMALCAVIAPLLCWKINLGLLHWWSRRFQTCNKVGLRTLFLSSCFGFKNLSSDIVKRAWYSWCDNQLKWVSCSNAGSPVRSFLTVVEFGCFVFVGTSYFFILRAFS